MSRFRGHAAYPLSQDELAATMGRSVPSARNLLARALVRLSAVLEQLDLGGW